MKLRIMPLSLMALDILTLSVVTLSMITLIHKIKILCAMMPSVAAPTWGVGV